MAHQLNNWQKAYIATGCALGMWLAAQAPVGRIAKGIFLSVGLMHSVALVRIAKPLITEEAYLIAKAVMDKELQNTELVLNERQMEGELQKLYAVEGSEGSYEPEIIDELRNSLEALWGVVAAEPSSEVTSSEDRKNLYLAIVNLLEMGQTETFIIKEVLGCQGRNYQQGKELLAEILQEGRESQW